VPKGTKDPELLSVCPCIQRDGDQQVGLYALHIQRDGDQEVGFLASSGMAISGPTYEKFIVAPTCESSRSYLKATLH
jgi:hypothetical protein